MALLKSNHLSQYEIQKEFVYKATLAGVIPVYLGDLGEENCKFPNSPKICEVNGCPRIALHATFFILGWTQLLMGYLNIPCNGYPIIVTARLDGEPLGQDEELN